MLLPLVRTMRAAPVSRALFGAILTAASALAYWLALGAPTTHATPVGLMSPVAIAAIVGRFPASLAAIAVSGLILVLCPEEYAGGRVVALVWLVAGGLAISLAANLSHDLWRLRSASKRRHSASVWRRSESLRLALEAGAIGTFEADLVKGEVRLSVKLQEIWGVTGDAPVKPGALDMLVVDEDRAERAEAQARSAHENGRYRSRFRIRRGNDDALRWIETSGQVYFDRDAPVRVIGVTRDITDEMTAAAVLEEKAKLAEQLTLLATALPGAIYSYVTTPDRRDALAYASPNFAKLLGFSAEALCENVALLKSRAHPEDLPAIFAAIDESARTLGPWRGLFRFDHPAKGEIWLEGHSQPARQEDGSIIWHGYLQDVTAREAAAPALAESEARVRALKDERLAALEKMAARLSHEVNQPLAAGATLLAVARRRLQSVRLRDARDEDLTKAADALEKAADQVLRAGRIISRLRDFSRHGEPNKTFRSLHVTIRETLAGLRADSGFAGVEIATRFEAARDHVLIDRLQIAEVLVNLLQNARQAALPEAAPTIVVASRNDEDNIEISVIDYGTGLSEDARRHLFELFWTSKISGMGVGLALSRAIIEAHSGVLSAQDSPAGQTVFIFSLPLVE
jgi:two-component system sensor kinase FixL